MKVSVIIVNYHVEKDLLYCLTSLYASKPKNKFEVIVVDNDEKKTLKASLKKAFPDVLYIPNENKGYGQGNNTGAKVAKGEYLFILNPDTKVYKGCIDYLVEHLKKNKKVGIAAPFLYEENDSVVPLQGARTLDPLSAIFSFSIIHKLFPQNPIAKKYWLFDKWNGKSTKPVESVPGAAFMIRKEIFDKIGGFDEQFFLFFEEHDLSKQVKELGWRLVMLPQAKVFHALGDSMKKSKKNIARIFTKSRMYYFKKHFGLLTALFTEGILRINKYFLLILGITAVGLFLRLHTIYETMPFIGDQGWFYLSARDMLLTGNIPLVGIESSHPWIHQGAFWTYLVAVWFWLFGFHPVSPAFLSALIDAVAIVMMYLLATKLFSQRAGIIAAFLYATSPYVIINARMPYHTSPIPLLIVIYLYFLAQWIMGKKYAFPWVIFCLAMLYNFELVTVLFSFVTGLIFFYGFIKKKSWVRKILNKKIIGLSLLGFVVPMLPMLIYDLSHTFSQTLKLLVWIGYRILVLFGYPEINPTLPHSVSDMSTYFGVFYEKLLFPGQLFVAVFIVIAAFLFLALQLVKKKNDNLVLIGLVHVFLIIGILIAKTPSGAYLTLLFPTSLILLAVFYDALLRYKILHYLLPVLLLLMTAFSISHFIDYKYSFITNDNPYARRLEIAKEIVKESQGKEYNLITEGKDRSIPNFSKNYEYLTWWIGHPPSEQKQSLLFVVEEKSNDIKIRKEQTKDK